MYIRGATRPTISIQYQVQSQLPQTHHKHIIQGLNLEYNYGLEYIIYIYSIYIYIIYSTFHQVDLTVYILPNKQLKYGNISVSLLSK